MLSVTVHVSVSVLAGGHVGAMAIDDGQVEEFSGRGEVTLTGRRRGFELLPSASGEVLFSAEGGRGFDALLGTVDVMFCG
jgi:hypothetical protein